MVVRRVCSAGNSSLTHANAANNFEKRREGMGDHAYAHSRTDDESAALLPVAE